MPKNKAGRGSSDSVKNRSSKGGAGLRSSSKVARLKMYRDKINRNKAGKVVGGNFMMRDRTANKLIDGPARIAPNRKWFGNTRTIGAEQLDKFRTAVAQQVNNPFSVVLRSKKLPMSLLAQPTKKAKRMNLLTTETYEDTFGKSQKRKRPKLKGAYNMTQLIASAKSKIAKYEQTPSSDVAALSSSAATGDAGAAHEDLLKSRDAMGSVTGDRQPLFDKGQSKRIWNELYKVLDCSDVVMMVLDARNPEGTRCAHVEHYLRKHAKHKHLVFILNKVDLIPNWITRKWIKILSKEYPTIACHANMKKPFGKGAIISLLQQFSRLHKDKQQISVGMIGYPNVGKSSIINTLKHKKVCKVAPIPGETKVWQYVTLMKRIFLIDCPGVVYDIGDSEAQLVMKGVVRAEKLTQPEHYIPDIIAKATKDVISRTYDIPDWTDEYDFLEKLAAKKGRLLKGGEKDIDSVAKMVINDWQRGVISYFYPPIKGSDADEPDEKETRDLVESEAVAMTDSAAAEVGWTPSLNEAV